VTDRPFIVVSGLPGSGKTTLAVGLARELGLPLLDKDDILEALFESFETIDLATRQRLSRASDVVLAKIAARSPGAVIVSFWRRDGMDGTSGTPTGWLSALPQNLLEVHCDCPAALAEARFRARQRHAGHHDGARLAILHEQLQSLAALGPLKIGPLVTVPTSGPYDLLLVAQEVQRRLDDGRA